ncbi:MAG: RIP metalloprotease RseP [Pseudoxanthomonas suwonensis]|nr:RIP metalloprotease RseP [Pseudoxanthomonas suwonensis]
MSEFIGSLWWLVVSIGVLVTFHEFGHYWVARRCGVHVLRFSVGFGKPLWSRQDRHGTEWAVAAIPLGGYVKMLDEREYEIPAGQLDQTFNRKSVWQRIAIVAAGPVANLLLCVLLLWGMFLLGRPDYRPVVGHVQGIAAQAGLRADDVLLQVGGRDTATWSEAALALTTAGMDRDELRLRVRDAEGVERERVLPLSRLPQGLDERRIPAAIGITPRHLLLPPVLGTIEPDAPAAGVLQASDRITAIDARRITHFEQIGPLLQQWGREEGATGSGEVMVEVLRNDQRLALPLRPRLHNDPQRGDYWILGIRPAAGEMPAYDASQRFGAIAAVPAAFRETARLARDSLGMIGRMFSGRASVENVSGPITIARYANASAQLGPAWFLSFLALLSLSLAIINLLPIPVLDGGHLLYYLIELVKGSPLSERAMAAGQYLGLAAIAGLMGLAFYNDLLGLLR